MAVMYCAVLCHHIIQQEWNLSAFSDEDYVGRNYGFMIPNCMNSLREDGSLAGSLAGTNEHRLINLNMGEVFSIEDCFEGNTMVEQFSLGLQWDMVEGMVLDLDLGCVCLSGDLKMTDSCHFRQLVSEDKAIVHGGDTLDDAADKDDDEEIHIDLTKINPLTEYIAFYVTSYEGHELNEVERCFAHFYVTATKRDIFTFVVDDGSDNSGIIIIIIIMSVGIISR
jgi:tellurium resistance protein TerZ